MRLVQEVRRVEWRETAGELGALLLESRLVKTMQPILNRRLRNEKQLVAWRLGDDPVARPLLELVRMDEVDGTGLAQLYGVYRSKRQALEALRELAQNHGLCPQALGVESGKGPCFASQIGQCKGVCAGRESPAVHHLRLQLAMQAQRLQAWPCPGRVALREHDPQSGRTDVHVFDQWCHLATVHDEAGLEAALHARSDGAPLAFDLDTYRLLLKRLSGAAAGKVIALPAPEPADSD
jgi:DNA polymerase-3 subunit epsilon